MNSEVVVFTFQTCTCTRLGILCIGGRHCPRVVYVCGCLDGGSELDVSSPLIYGTPSSRAGDTPRTPGAAGTPHRSRSDVRSERRPTVAVGASSEPVLW